MTTVNSRAHWLDRLESPIIWLFLAMSGFVAFLVFIITCIRPFFLQQMYTYSASVDYLLASSIVIIAMLAVHKIKLTRHNDNAISLFALGLLIVTCLLVIFLQKVFYLRSPMLIVFTLVNFSMCFAVYRWLWNPQRLSLFLSVSTITFLNASFSILGTFHTIQEDTEHLFRIKPDKGPGTVFIARNNLYGYSCPGEYFDGKQCRQVFFKGSYEKWENAKKEIVEQDWERAKSRT